jgi:SAM-dependent methyltransferase
MMLSDRTTALDDWVANGPAAGFMNSTVVADLHSDSGSASRQSAPACRATIESATGQAMASAGEDKAAASSPDGRLAHIREHPELSRHDLKLIATYHPSAATLLDIGAGRGGFVMEAIRAGLTAVALDAEPDVIPIWRRDRIPGLLADAFHPPFRPHTFDVVRGKEIIEHVADPLKLVKAMRGLLKPGGLLLVHVPSPYSQLYPVGNFWDDYTHVRPLSRMGLQRLVEDGGLSLRYLHGYTAGRGPVERMVAGVLSKFLPHSYVLVAQRFDR